MPRRSGARYLQALRRSRVIRRLICAFAALTIIVAGCGQAPDRVAVGLRPSPTHVAGRPYPSAWSPELGPALAPLIVWHAAERYGAVVAWNEATRPPAAPQAARSAPKTRVIPPRNGTGQCGGWRDLVASFWPASQVPTACRIMLCESGGNPSARNPSGAIGLFQLLGHGGTTDPVQNATVAYRLWLSESWRPWVCR